MKKIVLLPLIFTTLFAEFEYKGNIQLDSQYYLKHPDGKNSFSETLLGQVEIKYDYEDFEFASTLNIPGVLCKSAIP